MISMQGVSSALIARNESWVRQQATAMARRLPSNVEKADLIQAGLIAVAQAALAFKWEGARDSAEAEEAFLRYARMRVKGAMIDELRQMDSLGRAQRRKVKVIQIARERWHATHGVNPSLSELGAACSMSMEEIAQLEQAALMALTGSPTDDAGATDRVHQGHEQSTPKDEVEARVDTGIVMRHLEAFFAGLPQRDRQVIDAYLGIGMTPIELAGSLKVTPSRVSQMYKELCVRIARHFGQADRRAHGALGVADPIHFEGIVAAREAELAAAADGVAWGKLMEEALTMPTERFGGAEGPARIEVTAATRWT